MPGLVINPRARIFHGHDWVYSSEVKKTFGDPQIGEVVSLKDYKDRPLGSAIYNPKSQIVARRISRRKQKLDREFFHRRITQAIALRERCGINSQVARLVWSESDGLPGLIIDRYEQTLVVQTTTYAMHQSQDLISEVLLEVLNPRSIILRNDSPMLIPEGLSEEVRLLHGPDPGKFPVQIQDLQLLVHPLEAQKTGLYLDITDAYPKVAQFARDRSVLDVFCNAGGFGLSCAKMGAKAVKAIDISAEATEATEQNAALNGLSIETLTTNAFNFLRTTEETFDLIILDPPSFTRNKKTLREAMRGYKEIHLRALKLLNHDGILATFCCSHHATREVFLESISSAAVDAKKTLRLIESHQQRLDHPIIPTLPETEYLKGFTFQLLPNR